MSSTDQPMTLPARLPIQLYPAGHFWRTFQHIATAGVTLDQVANPGYWHHVANSLQRRDIIEVIADDSSFKATLHVLNASKGALALGVSGAGITPITPMAPAIKPTEPVSTKNTVDGLEVSFAKADKHRVIDTATKEVVSKGHATEAEAEKARENLLTARKAAA